MPARRVALFVIAGLVACAGALWLQRAAHVWRSQADEIHWQPRAGAEDSWRDLGGLAGATEVRWTLQDGSVQRAVHVPSRNGGMVIYAHGSPGYGAAWMPEARALAARGWGGVLVDLPGYGGSEGPRSWGASYRESLRAAVDFALAQPGVDAGRIAIFGYSMGTPPAATVAAADPRIRAVVLVAPFTTFPEQLRYQYRTRVPFVPEVAVLASRKLGMAVDELDARDAMRRLGDRPALLIVGERDQIVEPAMTVELASFSQAARARVLPGVGHVDIAKKVGDAYFAMLQEFLDGALGSPATGP